MTPYKHLYLLLFWSFSLTLLFAQKATTLPDWKVQPIELKQLNSSFRDVNISITPNGKYLYFMSGRGGMPWSNNNYTTFRGKPEGDGDLWYSQLVDGTWQPPQCVGRPVCTSSGEDEPNISADGQTVYFQSWKSSWRYDGGPYYRAELRGNKWENPVGMGGGINAFFSENGFATDGMSISPDGKIFVVAAGADYDGELDIYISRKNAAGVWSYPQKLAISTDKDERSVFIAADNKTLYFGSAGWGGFGKLDIFKTTLEGGTKCGEIINVGKPFNTREEDYGFVIDAVRNDVFFVRNSDIFYAHLGEQADERIKPTPVVVIDGKVTDSNGKPREAIVRIIDGSKKDTISLARSNAITGEYSLTIPKKEGIYWQQIQFNDSYVEERELTITADTKPQIEIPIVGDIEKLEPKKAAPPTVEPVVEQPVTLIKEPVLVQLQKTIYFDFDQAVLSQTDKDSLDILFNELIPAQIERIELVGHTDAVGSSEYNQMLSEKRVRNTVIYLKEKGLNIQMNTTAKGESEPAVANSNNVAHAKNRRVEIRITYKK